MSYGGYLDTVRRSFVQPSVSQIPGKEWNVEKKGYIEKKGLLNKVNSKDFEAKFNFNSKMHFFFSSSKVI